MIKHLVNLIAMIAMFAAGAARGESVMGLELRSEAAILGDSVRLKQIARWTEADAPFFRELGEMTVVRFTPEQREMTVSMETVRTMLEGAGVNEGQLSMRGPTSVRVRRLDADAAYAKVTKTDKPKDLEGFMAQKPVVAAPEQKPLEAIDALLPVKTDDLSAGYSLKQGLTQFLSDRINIPVDDLEISYPATFERVLGVTGPAYTWTITTFRSSRLGPVNFKVTLKNGASVRQVEISGTARAWQQQLRVARPVAAGATLREADVEYKRVLVDSMGEQMPVRKEFAMAMEAKRDLRPGEVLTVGVLNPVLMVKRGQYISITSRSGTIEMKAVGIAKDDAAYGAPVRVEIGDGKQKREVVVTMTGPQEGRTGAPEALLAQKTGE